MNPFNIFNTQLINLLFTFSIYFFIKEAASHRTLNFDRESHALVDIEGRVNKKFFTIGYELAIACPADHSFEVQYSNDSIGKSCLFVRGTYESSEDLNLVLDNNNICRNVYKLSISYYRTTQEIDYGYEVYYDKEKYSNFKDSNYDEYDPKRRLLTNSPAPSKQPLKLKTSDGKFITLGFVWISKFKLNFDKSTKSAIHVTYTLSKGTEMDAECKDYLLGDEVYEQDDEGQVDVDSLYMNQVNIFENVRIPEHDSECEKRNQCLSKYSLLPTEEFRFRSPEPLHISCSNLTTVPIWQSEVGEALRELDKFLYALIEFAHSDMQVISGVHGQLRMPQKNRRGNVKISLGETPVPNIIYKYIKYEYTVKVKAKGFKTKFVDVSSSESVVIMIHNDPNFKKTDALCSKENCEQWGWQQTLKDDEGNPRVVGVTSNNAFCCSTEEIATKLGIKQPTRPASELKLNTFSVYREDERLKLGTENIMPKVIKKMKEMFRNEDSKGGHSDAPLRHSDENSSRGETGRSETM